MTLFVAVGLTHEERIEEQNKEMIRQNEELIKRLDLIALILERDAETGATLAEVTT